MRKRDLAPWVRVAVAAVVISLVGGAGLPGIVSALAPTSTHVCTCASGGNHRACPICNSSLGLAPSRASKHRAVRGVPCGDPRVAIAVPGDLGTLPEPSARLVVGSEPANSARDVMRSPDQAPAETATPPPRSRCV